MAQQHAPAALTPRQARKAIVAATTGNALEFYDFITYAFFAIQIGQTFFPSTSAFASLMASLVTFGAGFVTRPLGAFVLGRYADKAGRKPSMMLSMLLMGTGMILLVVTPGYATIGLAAPVIAVSARLIQGFALGGEVGSATAYMLEASPPDKRALTVSWQAASQQVAATLGSLIGLGLSLWLTTDELTAFGWRIALAIGASIVPFALWIRSSLPETLHQAEAPDEVEDAGIRSYAKVLVLGFLMIGSGTIGTYVFNYISTFGQNTLHLSAAVSMGAEFGVNLMGFVFALWGGLYADRWGRRPMMIWPQLLFTVATMPFFLWITHSGTAFAFIAGMLILSILSTPQYAAVYATINESLPRAVRARAFALVYAVPVALLGGTTQPFVTWLLHVTGDPNSLGWYLTLVSAIGLVAMWLMHETSPRHKLVPPLVGEPVPL
jgi:MFS family permease